MEITKRTNEQIEKANNIRVELNKYLSLIEKYALKRKEGNLKKCESIKDNMKLITDSINNINEADFFTQNLSDLLLPNICEAEKVIIISNLADSFKEYEKLHFYCTYAFRYFKSYIENTDPILRTGIIAKNMEKEKMYRLENKTQVKGCGTICAGSILYLSNNKNKFGDHEIVIKGNIEMNSIIKGQVDNYPSWFIFNTKEISNLELVEIDYNAKKI